jgi:hypothetical protein
LLLQTLNQKAINQLSLEDCAVANYLARGCALA